MAHNGGLPAFRTPPRRGNCCAPLNTAYHRAARPLAQEWARNAHAAASTPPTALPGLRKSLLLFGRTIPVFADQPSDPSTLAQANNAAPRLPSAVRSLGSHAPSTVGLVGTLSTRSPSPTSAFSNSNPGSSQPLARPQSAQRFAATLRPNPRLKRGHVCYPRRETAELTADRELTRSAIENNIVNLGENQVVERVDTTESGQVLFRTSEVTAENTGRMVGTLERLPTAIGQEISDSLAQALARGLPTGGETPTGAP